jgi:hypothetical protein
MSWYTILTVRFLGSNVLFMESGRPVIFSSLSPGFGIHGFIFLVYLCKAYLPCGRTTRSLEADYLSTSEFSYQMHLLSSRRLNILNTTTVLSIKLFPKSHSWYPASPTCNQNSNWYGQCSSSNTRDVYLTVIGSFSDRGEKQRPLSWKSKIDRVYEVCSKHT